ncbi:MAG: hypothetical protein II574_01635 [Ruminococcus sp.]|nr:hypothetical protein [Ruminococcus sp.]
MKNKKVDVFTIIMSSIIVILGIILIFISIFDSSSSKGVLIGGLLCVNTANVINIIRIAKSRKRVNAQKENEI